MQTKVIEKPKNKARVGGNILSKTGLGAYTYGSARPHAVTGVENTGYVIQSAAQHIDYNPWGKASRIEEGQYSQTLRYGPDRQRWVVTYSMGGRFTTMDPLCEKYYGVSPYAYCNDNPIIYKDDDGRFPTLFPAVLSNIWQKIRHSDQYVSNLVDHGDRIEPERRYTYTSVDYHSEEGITVTSHSRFDWDGILADAKTSGDALQDIGDVVTIAGLATACFFPPAGASIAKAGEALSKIGLSISLMADMRNGNMEELAKDIGSRVIGRFGKELETQIDKLDIGDDLSKNILKFYNESGKDLIDKAKDKFIEMKSE